MRRKLTFRYRNWRGEESLRVVTPKRIWFGTTRWHPEPQWFLKAFDREKDEHRDFALRDCDFVRGEEVVDG